MKATEIIYSALEKSGIELPELDLEETEGNCMMCGKAIKEGVKYKKVVSANFTDYDVFANIQGTHICKECATCVKLRELRVNNIIADENNLYLLKKNDLEEYLFNIDKYVSGDFIIGITRSFKKHNSYRCKVNNNTNVFIIREEDKEYVFDRERMKKPYDIIWDMYMYFQKDEILTGRYSIARIEEYGLERFKAHEDVIKQYRDTHQFDLLVYILNSEERNKIVEERIKKHKEEKKNKHKNNKMKKEKVKQKVN